MIIVPTPTPVLVFDGDLDCNGPNTDPYGIDFTIETAGPSATTGGSDLTWGSPDAITREIAAQLGDGTLVTVDGVTNRVVVLPLRIKAATSAGLAAGEAELMRRSGDRATTLAWTPPVLPGDTALTSIFEVRYSELAPTADMLAEQRYTRYWTLTLTAKPYTRSVNLIVVPALDSVPLTDGGFVSTVVDACSSTTGWAGAPHAVALGGTSPDESVAETITTIDASRIASGPFSASPKYTLTLTRTSSAVDMSTTPYLIIKSGMPGIAWTQTVKADGHTLQLVSQSGRDRTYKMPTGVTSFTVLVITASFFTKHKMTVPLRVYSVTKSNGTGSIATGKQLARSLWVKGSAPTSGSVSVQHEADGLEDVIVYTVPSSTAGYVPAMQRYQTDGPTPTSDTDAVTGVKQLISQFDDTPTFTISSDQLIEGNYGVAVRIKSADPNDYNVVVQAAVAGHTLATENMILRSVVNIASTDDDPTAADYKIHWLGTMQLPPVALPDESTQDIIATILALPTDFLTGGEGDVYLDELWMFNLDDGAVTILSAGAAQRVWLDSPDGDRQNPRLFVGTADDRSDAVGVDLAGLVLSLGRHRLLPGRMDVFTVATGAANAAAAVGYYPRWHTHAAE